MNPAVLGRAATALADGLWAGGVREAVVCPGSRSTPFALALWRHPGIRVLMHYDERSAGYFALGIARGARRAVAVLTTSGTAAGNLLPAVMEARHGGGALVVLTADRPPELRDVGASQTADQVKIYGDAVKSARDVWLPDEGVADGRWRQLGYRAAETAQAAPAGPVHLNLPVREPLLPQWGDSALPGVGEPPPPSVRRSPCDAVADAIAAWADREPRGLIVAGAEDMTGAAESIWRLSDRLGWPVWADPLANLRGRGETVVTYDWLARSVPSNLLPRKVLRFGPPPTSKAANTALRGVPTAVVDAPGRWRDPEGTAVAWFHVDLADWGAAAATATARQEAVRSPWRTAWAHLDRQARALLDDLLATTPPNYEGRWARDLAAVSAHTGIVMVGNSLPMRDADQWFVGSSRVALYGNRGLAGIDGVTSTGLGMALARQQGLLLVVGDLSFAHDLNGLMAAHLHAVPATVLVVNNNGGGIFSTIAQANLPSDQFEPLFGTPHHLDFAGAALLFGAEYHRVAQWPEAADRIRAAGSRPGITVVDWMTLERRQHATLGREMAARAAELLQPHWEELRANI